MHLIDYIVLALVLVPAAFAAARLWKRRGQGGCAGCQGGCAGCPHAAKNKQKEGRSHADAP